MENTLMSQEHNHNIDDIKTLDEAKQIILRFLEYQETVYSFLHNFCNSDIKEPLLTMKGYVELLQNASLAKHQSLFLKVFERNQERILRRIDIVRDVARYEKDGQKLQERLKKHYPPEVIELNSLLAECVSEIQNDIDFESNEYAAFSSELDKKIGVTSRAKDPLRAVIKIGNSLPTVQCNPAMLRVILSNVVWFFREEMSKTEIRILTDFDEEWVKIVFSCFTFTPHTYVLRDYQNFETASTFLSFVIPSLFLYDSWRLLKIYDGLLMLNIQDNQDLQKLSSMEITIYLKR